MGIVGTYLIFDSGSSRAQDGTKNSLIEKRRGDDWSRVYNNNILQPASVYIYYIVYRERQYYRSLAYTG